jgi:hypothetical protein
MSSIRFESGLEGKTLTGKKTAQKTKQGNPPPKNCFVGLDRSLRKTERRKEGKKKATKRDPKRYKHIMLLLLVCVEVCCDCAIVCVGWGCVYAAFATHQSHTHALTLKSRTKRTFMFSLSRTLRLTGDMTDLAKEGEGLDSKRLLGSAVARWGQGMDTPR